MTRLRSARGGRWLAAAFCAMALLAAGCGSASGPPSPSSATTTPTTQCGSHAAGTATVPPLAAVEFVSAQQGWVVGADRILATSDGGQAWRTQYRGAAKLDQVDFVDAKHGWAVGTNDLLATTDGGAVWTRLAEPCPVIRSVHFATPSVGYAVAGGSDLRIDGGVPAPVSGGRLLITTDSGRTWQPVSGAPAMAQTVCFGDPADGYLGTPGQIWRSTDGGRRWSRSYAEPARPGYSQHEPGDTAVVQCAGQSAAWMLFLGFGAALSHSPYIAFATQDARTWHALFEETYTESAIMPEVHAPAGPGSYPGPFSAISPDSAAFVGSDPSVGLGAAPLEMVTGGGADSSKQGYVSDVTQAYGVAFVSSSQGWVIGTDQTVAGQNANYVIESTADGGRTWTRQYQTG
ncbi:MAG TPA: YCF48-related protein [Streptosporangiaceae bacterium]